jgi:hypothetical protein
LTSAFGRSWRTSDRTPLMEYVSVQTCPPPISTSITRRGAEMVGGRPRFSRKKVPVPQGLFASLRADTGSSRMNRAGESKPLVGQRTPFFKRCTAVLCASLRQVPEQKAFRRPTKLRWNGFPQVAHLRERMACARRSFCLFGRRMYRSPIFCR